MGSLLLKLAISPLPLPVLVEPGGPPEGREGRGDREEASVPGAPGLVPVSDEPDVVDPRDPPQKGYPGVLISHRVILSRSWTTYLIYSYNNLTSICQYRR